MSEHEKPTPLGPLPKSDRADELEELSENVLRASLSPKSFRLRSEPGKDRGNDRYLEVKIDGHDTNCRSQVQLKGTDSQKLNQDGSMSVQIEVSNLNYMLNGASPLYVLWLEKKKELRYVWGRDEAQRLETDSPNWQSQKKISLRFAPALDAPARQEIHERILREAQLDRRVHELLARRTETEIVSIHIDSKTLELTDTDVIHRLLIEGGMTVVASGFGQQALNAIEKLDPIARNEPRIALIRAYAFHSVGRHHLAQGYLSEAMLQRQDLSESDQSFLDSLRDICSFRLGQITLDEYLEREDELAAELEGVSALSHRLETLRYGHLRERRIDRRGEPRKQIDALVAEIEAHPDSPEGLKVNAHVVQLYASGQDCVLDATHCIGVGEMRTGMGLAPSAAASSAVQRINERWDKWLLDINVVYKDAYQIAHPILIGDALFVRATVIAASMTRLAANEFTTGRKDEGLETAARQGMADAETAMKVYRQAGCLEAELRSQLLLADLFEISGQQEAAVQLARGVLPAVQAMQYARLEEHSREHISGTTILSNLKSALARASAEDEDYDLATLTDETINSMSIDCIAALELPHQRVHVVERYWKSRRSIASERIAWCRYIELLDHLVHESSPATMYREAVDQMCTCKKFEYMSTQHSNDWERLVAEFKSRFCENCDARDPKGPASE